MADLTRQEFANALRAIADAITAIAANYDETTPTEPLYLVTENGVRLRVVDSPATYLVVEEPTTTSET